MLTVRCLLLAMILHNVNVTKGLREMVARVQVGVASYFNVFNLRVRFARDTTVFYETSSSQISTNALVVHMVAMPTRCALTLTAHTSVSVRMDILAMEQFVRVRYTASIE